MNILKKLKNHFLGIAKIKTSPKEIAIGFSIGTFLEFLIPLPFLDFAMALVLASIFKRISKIAMLSALILWNAAITWPLFALSYKLGNFLFGDARVILFNIVFLDNIYNFSRRLIVGNIIIGSFLSIAFYFIVYYVVKKYQEKAHETSKV